MADRSGKVGSNSRLTTWYSLIPSMIRLSDDDIIEFQALYQRETGTEISREEAAEYAERLIRVVAFAAGVDLSPPPG